MSAVLNFIRLQDLIDQNALQGKRVFIRADLNVPQDDSGKITEDTRIRASVPAIRAALAAGAAVMVTSHLGRPTEGEFKPADSLAPVAARLSELLGQEVVLKQDWIDGAGLDGGLNRGNRSADARIFGDVAVVVLRHVQVGADEYALALQGVLVDQILQTDEVENS